MTINILTEISHDIFAYHTPDHYDLSNFDPPKPPLSAITFVAKTTNSVQNLRDIAEACGGEAFLAVKSNVQKAYKGWLFVSNGAWRERSRIVEYKKLCVVDPKNWTDS